MPTLKHDLLLLINYDTPPPLVVAFGEPHLQSFDRGYFDFNGVGEYVVFCGIVDGKINENLEWII